MMPIFIIIFSLTFQMMVSTYSKYKFSYILTNAVRMAVKNQPIYTNIADYNSYSIRDEVERLVTNALVGESAVPYTDVQIGTVETGKITYLIGAFQYKAQNIFLGEVGQEYFYFFVPISTAYAEPLTLNKTQLNVESYFEWYFTLYAKKYYEGT